MKATDRDQAENGRLSAPKTGEPGQGRNLRLGVAAGLLSVLFSVGCAQRVPFAPSHIAPAAEAKVKVSEDKNGNTHVDLRVDHLARPENLNPPKAVYVVWAQAPDGHAVNLGQLNVNKKLRGRFRAVTGLKRFRLLITAEDLPIVRTPSPEIVLKTTLVEVS